MNTKDRLYTVNKGNRDTFNKANLFFGGGPFGETIKDIVKDMKGKGTTAGSTAAGSSVSSGLGINPTSIGLGTALTAAQTIGSNVTVGDTRFKRGLYDMADPLHWAAAGRETGVGNVLGDVSTEAFKLGASTGNVPLMIAGGIGKGASSTINGLFGYMKNKDTINSVNANNEYVKKAGDTLSRALNTNDFMTVASSVDNKMDISKKGFKNSWFNINRGGDAAYNSINNKQDKAYDYYASSLYRGAENVDKTTDNNIFQNFSAFGGPIDILGNTGMGAVDYGFVSDYVLAKNKQAESTNSKTVPLNFNNQNLVFANGGMLENSDNYTDGEVLDVSPEEAKRLMDLGYDFDIMEE